jgi:Ribbon-helix-helix domain
MPRKVRKQFYITSAQDKELKEAAREFRVSEAELVRWAIDEVTRTGGSFMPDDEAWKAAKTFMEKRAGMKVPQKPRTWTREELYDERFHRLSD